MAKLFVLLVAIVLVFWQTTANHEPGHVGNDDNGFLRRNNEGGLLGRNRNRDSTFDNNRNSDVNNDRVGRTGSNGDFNGNTNGGQGGDDQNGDMGSTDSGFTGPDPFATSTSGGIQEGNSTTPSGQANDQTLPGNFSSTPGRSHTVSQGKSLTISPPDTAMTQVPYCRSRATNCVSIELWRLSMQLQYPTKRRRRRRRHRK